ncbi:hypothetical protein, partial [Alkalibacillus silvisoli]|uniref:hypothetical protein n=1 Tax=Alkalibacillus silvisoli TaxID=392823 RepID=UPI0031D4146C
MSVFFDLPLKLNCEQEVSDKYFFVESINGELFIVGMDTSPEGNQTYNPFERDDIIPSLVDLYENMKDKKVNGMPEDERGKDFAKAVLNWVSKYGYLTTKTCYINAEEKVNGQSLEDFRQEWVDIILMWESFSNITNLNEADVEYLALQIEEKINHTTIFSMFDNSFNLLFKDKRVTKDKFKKTLNFNPEIKFNHLLSALYVKLLMYMRTDNIKVCPGCKKPFEAT